MHAVRGMLTGGQCGAARSLGSAQCSWLSHPTWVYHAAFVEASESAVLRCLKAPGSMFTCNNGCYLLPATCRETCMCVYTWLQLCKLKQPC